MVAVDTQEVETHGIRGYFGMHQGFVTGIVYVLPYELNKKRFVYILRQSPVLQWGLLTAGDTAD